jgi:hypothetical protein
MSKSRATSMGLALAALVLAVPAYAQGRSAVSTAELDAAVATRPASNRETVRNFLANEQVQSAATRMGVSAKELSAGVASLDQSTVDRIAQQNGVADLAGGDQKIVVSATVVIIALLIIILLVK